MFGHDSDKWFSDQSAVPDNFTSLRVKNETHLHINCVELNMLNKEPMAINAPCPAMREAHINQALKNFHGKVSKVTIYASYENVQYKVGASASMTIPKSSSVVNVSFEWRCGESGHPTPTISTKITSK